jgi:hypothetical protein
MENPRWIAFLTSLRDKAAQGLREFRAMGDHVRLKMEGFAVLWNQKPFF